MKNKSIKEVVFSKEDLHNKKLLTSFLIGNNVEFIPDQHNHGKWKALIRINASPINKQIQRTLMSESISKSPKSVKPFSPKSVKPFSPKSVSPKPRSSIQNVQYFSSNKDQPHFDFKEKSGITLFLDQTIKRMNQQAEVMSTYSQEIETLNHRLQNFKIVNQIQKYLFYKDMAKHSINKIGYDGILQKGCNCKAYNVTISFFLVGLYYHYLQREQEYLQDFHEMMMSLNQQERNCIRIESLRSILDLFETMFLVCIKQLYIQQSQKFQHQQGIQRFVNDINNQIKQKQNLNLLRVCALMFNQQLERKLELLSKSLQQQNKNENIEIRPQNGLNQPQTHPLQSLTPNKQKQTPPQSYTPQKQNIPQQQIIKNDSGLKIENLKKQKIDNDSTYTSIQKSQKHITPTKSIHKTAPITQNQQQLTPQTKQNNIKYLQRQKIKNNKKQSKIQDSYYQTFRPTTPQIDENSVNVKKTSEFDPSINRLKKKKTLTQTLEKKFLQIIEQELQNAHSQWFKKIQISDKYILSPQSAERHYEQALDRFMPDRVQYMSSDELVHYYDFVVKKSKHIYLQQLRQKGLRQKSFSPQDKQK